LPVMCGLCGRSRAAYYRASSGHKLCARCLFRVLERSVGRSVSRAGFLRRGEPLLVPVTFSDPTASLALALILSIVERKHESLVHVVVPEVIEVAGDSLRLLGHGNTVLYRARLNPVPTGPVDAMALVRFDRAWSLLAAEELGVRSVMVPLNRTQTTLLGLEVMISGDPSGWWDLAGSLEIRGIRVLAPMDGIEAEAIAAYSYFKGLQARSPARPLYKLKGVFTAVLEGGGRELEFSSARVIQALSEASSYGLGGRCRGCGAPSGGDYCKWCAAMGVKGLSVELEGPLRP